MNHSQKGKPLFKLSKKQQKENDKIILKRFKRLPRIKEEELDYEDWTDLYAEQYDGGL